MAVDTEQDAVPQHKTDRDTAPSLLGVEQEIGMELQGAAGIDKHPGTDLNVTEVLLIGQDQIKGFAGPAPLDLGRRHKVHPNRMGRERRLDVGFDLAKTSIDDFEQIHHGRHYCPSEGRLGATRIAKPRS